MRVEFLRSPMHACMQACMGSHGSALCAMHPFVQGGTNCMGSVLHACT